MYKFNGLAIAVTLGLMTALPQAASAEVKIYPYASTANYCHAGLQPVSINGVICCGTPNTHVSYQSAMAHPVAKKKHHRVTHKAARNCAIGTKGCTFD
jgi:hypothetical protein